MYEHISNYLIYFYLLLDNAVKSDSKIIDLKRFFQLFSISDILVYSNVKNILINIFDISLLKKFFADESIDNQALKKYLISVHKILKLHIQSKIKFSVPEMLDKLSSAKKILMEMDDVEIVSYMLQIVDFLHKELSKKTTDIVLQLLFVSFLEYIDLFIDADEININEKYILERFKSFFEIFHKEPIVITFYNKKQNIKIMQDFFPSMVYEKIFEKLNFNTDFKLNEKYFFIEIDKKYCSESSSELLCHEIGHLLNLNVYNVQDEILNYFYSNLFLDGINIEMLNYWLNEIIADIIACNLCDKEDFLKQFNSLNEDNYSYKYPPLLFRKTILLDEIYDLNLITNDDAKNIASLIQNNIIFIKEMLSNVNC